MSNKNEGTLDRFIRIMLGIVMMAVGFGVMSGGGGIALGAIGAIVFFTGVTGVCLIYKLFNLNTLGKAAR
jgi:hypothetical protein